ncbi:Zinc finger protein 786 [Dissostichus eleginoides]|uniref:Zinc finger protein 786 n=1 Tax=Dissostichus eleginoides TaxID=100907 RepID=A0AAD9FFG7_DISEL|nr:Zinc finger protein 786 [Dissostichus eleginoides]
MFSPNQNRIRGPVRPCARGLNSVHNHLRAVRIRLSVGLLSGTAAQSQPRRGSDLRANSDPQPRVSPLLEAQSPADSPQQDRGLWLSFSPDPPASLCSANFPRVALFALFALFAPQLQNRTELNRTGSEQEERDKESRKTLVSQRNPAESRRSVRPSEGERVSAGVRQTDGRTI